MPSPSSNTFLRRWFVNTLGVVVAAHVVNGIHYDSITGLLIASLALGILNTFVRPVLLLLSLPFLLFTLGFFLLVINALMLRLVGWLVTPFHVDGFWAAFWGALIISLISNLSNWLLGNPPVRDDIQARRRRPPLDPPDEGGGPIIDV